MRALHNNVAAGQLKIADQLEKIGEKEMAADMRAHAISTRNKLHDSTLKLIREGAERDRESTVKLFKGL